MTDQKKTLTYCFTRDEGSSYAVRIGHEGPHQVGLGLVFSGIDPEHNGRWVLRQAIAFAESNNDDHLGGRIAREKRRVDITRVQPLLERPETVPFFVEVSDQEKDSLRRLLLEAETYWAATRFSSHEDEEEQLLGQLAESRMVGALGQCLDLKPVQMS